MYHLSAGVKPFNEVFLVENERANKINFLLIRLCRDNIIWTPPILAILQKETNYTMCRIVTTAKLL